MLKLLAIGLGLLIAIFRGCGVLFPGWTRNFASEFVSKVPRIRIAGIIVLGVSILILVAVGDNLAGARSIMGIIGIIWLLASFVLIFLPAQHVKLVNWFLNFSDGTIRIVSGIGFAFGILLLILGIGYY